MAGAITSLPFVMMSLFWPLIIVYGLLSGGILLGLLFLTGYTFPILSLIIGYLIMCIPCVIIAYSEFKRGRFDQWITRDDDPLISNDTTT